jgi:hypothetical protein
MAVKRRPVVVPKVIDPKAAMAPKWIVSTVSVVKSQVPCFAIPPIHFTITVGVPGGLAVLRTLPVRSASAGRRTV